MSLVAPGLISHLKTEVSRTDGSWETCYHRMRNALNRAIGVLEQIDHVSSGVELTMEVKKK